MTSIKSEPPTQDLNNNFQSPEKCVQISVPLLTPQNSPCASPRTPKSSPVSTVDLHSDMEDYKEDDEEVDEQQEVSVSKGKRPPGAVRRRNERERNRVKHINRTFSVLRQHLPSRKANKKLSKVETLRSAADYIKHLRQLLSDHDALTAAISLEQALIAHNQRQRFLHHPQQVQPSFHHQQQQQAFHRLQPQVAPPIHVYSQGGPSGRVSLNSSLCSPTGPVNSPGFSPMVSPSASAYQEWEQNNIQANNAVDTELMDLASESCMTDIGLW